MKGNAMTKVRTVPQWTCLEIKDTISHEYLLTCLGEGRARICNIVDAPTSAIVVEFWNAGDNVWEKAQAYVNVRTVSMGRWIPENITFVPWAKFAWTDDYSWDRTMTCHNHPSAKYYTKNFLAMAVFLVQSPNGYRLGEECQCGPDAMVVVCNAWGIALGKPADKAPITDEAVPPLPNGIDNWKLYANDNA